MGEIVQLEGGSAYFASAGSSKAPGVVVIQEWWGLQDQIKSVCDKYASAGYHAISPDLYAGRTVPYHDEGVAGEAMNALDFLSAADLQVLSAANFLLKFACKVGLTGFCLGGIVSVLGAIRLEVLSASSCYNRLPSPSLAAAGEVKNPIKDHFVLRDTWSTPSMVDALERELETHGKEPVIDRYDTDHGFLNPDIPEYDNVAAQLAWSRDLGFWADHLV